MKSKAILPVLAFILAFALSSFANKANDGPRIGYWDNPFIPGIQSGIVDCCVDASTVHCTETFLGNQVYAEPSLVTPLKKIFP